MKIQLTPPNNFSIAKNPQAYSAPPQRQGAIEEVKYAIVENSVVRLVQDAKIKYPDLATEFDRVLQQMKDVPQSSRIEVSKGKKTSNWTFRIYPAKPRENVENDQKYAWGIYSSDLDGNGILNMLRTMLIKLRTIED
jgi:hypothetical protein